MFGVQGLESGDPTIPSIEPANTDDPTDIPGSSANEGQDNHKDDLSTDDEIDTALSLKNTSPCCPFMGLCLMSVTKYNNNPFDFLVTMFLLICFI